MDVACPDGLTVRAARKVAVAVTAQALSSLSNFGVQLGLVLTMTPSRFGALVVGFAAYYFALALVRALVGDPLVALAAGDPGAAVPEQWRGGVLWAVLRKRVVIIGGGAVVVVAALALALGPVRPQLSLLALSLPALLFQDAFRSWFWARSRPELVVVLDGLWVVLSGLAVGTVAVVAGRTGVTDSVVLSAWVAGGSLSALAGWRMQQKWHADIPAVAGGGRSRGRLGDGSNGAGLSVGEATTTRSLGLSQAALAADANGLPAVIAAVAGSATSGGMRAAALPFMPVTTAVAALRMLTLPRLRWSVSTGRVGRTVLTVTAATAIMATVLAGLTLALLSIVPQSWLGPSGRLVQPWFFSAAIIVSARMITVPLSDVLSLGVDRRRVMSLRLGSTALDWTVTLTAAAVGGLSAAMQARTVAALAAVLLWGAAVGGATRRQSDRPSGRTQEEPESYVVA